MIDKLEKTEQRLSILVWSLWVNGRRAEVTATGVSVTWKQ